MASVASNSHNQLTNRPNGGAASRAAGRRLNSATRPVLFRAFLGTILFISALSFSGLNVLHTPAMFNDILLSPNNATPIVGHARFIRGDEFAVETPTALGQARSGFSDRLRIGQQDPKVTGQDADVHAYAPGPWSSLLARPLNVWFRVLSPERAVIARSWSVWLLTLFAFGYFVQTLAPGLPRSAIAGVAVASAFAPPLMWWSTLTHQVAVSSALIAASLLARGPRLRSAAAAGYLAGLGAITTYPAFFVSASLAAGLSLLPVLLAHRSRWPRIAVGFGVAAGTCLVIFLRSRPAFDAVRATAYPGHRWSSAGEDQWLRLGSGPFSRYLLNDGPVGFGNQTEVSSPLFLFPFAVAVLAMARFGAGLVRTNTTTKLCGDVLASWTPGSGPSASTTAEALPPARATTPPTRPSRPPALWGAATAGLLLLSWALGPLPTLVGRRLGLGFVPGARTVMGLVVVCAAFGAHLLARASRPTSRVERSLAVLGCVAVSAAVLRSGLQLRSKVSPGILSGREVVFFSLGFGMCLAGVMLLQSVSGKAWVAAGLSLLLAAGVHPLTRGLGPSQEVSREIQKIAAQYRGPAAGEQRWAAHEDLMLNSVVLSSGVLSVSGVHYHPDRRLWALLDPSGARIEEWNRYSHVLFRFGSGPKAMDPPTFTRNPGDAIMIDVGLCHRVVAELGIRHVVSRPAFDAPCIARVDKSPTSELLYTTLR